MKKTTLLKLRLKKGFKVYPTVLIITVLTLLITAFAGYNALNSFSGGEKKHKATIAVVGDVEGTVLETGLDALREIDSSRFMIDIVNMDEESAVQALKRNEITGYLIVPDSYIQDIFYGRNTPATFVTLSSSQTLGNLLISRVADIMSGLLTEAQAGVYSMQTVLEKNGLAEKIPDATTRLNLTYATNVIGREGLFDVKITGISGLSSGGYYLGAFLLFFLLLMGISFNRLLSVKNTPFYRSLSLSGIKALPQVMCEYFAYFTLSAITVLVFALFFGFFTEKVSPFVPELSGVGPVGCLGFIILIFPVIAMITMMQFMFYEFSDNIIASILIQFLLSVGLGYISGCFYPSGFFPDIVRKTAAILPSGVGFSYLRGALSGGLRFVDFAGVAVYFAVFTAITVAARKRRIAGDAV